MTPESQWGWRLSSRRGTFELYVSTGWLYRLDNLAQHFGWLHGVSLAAEMVGKRAHDTLELRDES